MKKMRTFCLFINRLVYSIAEISVDSQNNCVFDAAERTQEIINYKDQIDS